MLQIEGLSKRFGSFNAVDGISLTVPPGSIFGFVGSNGAGKTTTIRMVTLGSRPTAGSIRFKGRDVLEDSLAYKRQFGYVPAEPFLHDLMTGREFLHFVADLRELPGRPGSHRSGTLEELRAGSRGNNQQLEDIFLALTETSAETASKPDSPAHPS
mgnify:CR=1 FL=1